MAHTLKNSHLFSERVMLRMGTTLIMELGYQMRHPSHRFSTVMFNAISSTFMTTDIVTNGDSSLAKPERLCCHVTSLMLVCTAVLYLYYVRCVWRAWPIGDAKHAYHMCSISVLMPCNRCAAERFKFHMCLPQFEKAAFAFHPWCRIRADLPCAGLH